MDTHRSFDELDDSTVDELLGGRVCGERPDMVALAAFVAELRATYAQPPPAVVRADLASIFESGVPSSPASVRATPAHRAQRSGSRRRRVLGTLGTFVATVTGKAVLATAAVAVGVGGAHASGVVDVPGLPNQVAVDDAGPGANAGNEPEGQAAEAGAQVPADPGVDGADVSERARDGEPREDGRGFGGDVADEATDGTPAQEQPENCRAGDEDTDSPQAPSETPEVEPKAADPDQAPDDTAERARNGEPKEDGQDFGRDVADEATDHTPAQDCGQMGDEQPDAPTATPEPPAPDDDAADRQPDDPSSDSSDTADERRPTEAPVDRP